MFQNTLQLFITHAANVFLLETSGEPVVSLEEQVDICKRVLNMYRYMVMHTHMEMKTWLVCSTWISSPLFVMYFEIVFIPPQGTVVTDFVEDNIDNLGAKSAEEER